ncbi:MAG: TlpA family protein disulfide reductase [Aquificaceae bacterium]|nr:TlpA family protein disulfide reductase [Aquificaceae bacterium]
MPLRVGSIAPEFELYDKDGLSYSLQKTKGKKLLVFYKTTCPTCQLTLPFIERLYRPYGNSLSVWAIVQDPKHEVESFAKTYGITFPQLIDYPEYRVSVNYEVEIVPTIYLIDHDKVEFVSHSFVKADLIELNKRLAELSGVEPQDLFMGQRVPELKPG